MASQSFLMIILLPLNPGILSLGGMVPNRVYGLSRVNGECQGQGLLTG